MQTPHGHCGNFLGPGFASIPAISSNMMISSCLRVPAGGGGGIHRGAPAGSAHPALENPDYLLLSSEYVVALGPNHRWGWFCDVDAASQRGDH